MKRRDLIKLLKANGLFFIIYWYNNDIYTNGKASEPIPRHNEIKEQLAVAIIRRLGLK